MTFIAKHRPFGDRSCTRAWYWALWHTEMAKENKRNSRRSLNYGRKSGCSHYIKPDPKIWSRLFY